MTNLIDLAIRAAIEGSKEILEVYNSDFAVEHKDDKSPLTLADKNAHKAISKILEESGLPILSEEGRSIPFEERSQWEQFWMVDPVDGTKEFVKRNGEFTVNIALISNDSPVLGVIHVPVSGNLYVGGGEGAFLIEGCQEAVTYDQCVAQGQKLPSKDSERPYTMVGSRSHMSDETMAFMDEKKAEHGEVQIMAVGSSLKLCMVAEGKADSYPRYAPTMEWDTAAGHAICNAAGFQVYQYNSNVELQYNKEDLLNPWFLVE